MLSKLGCGNLREHQIGSPSVCEAGCRFKTPKDKSLHCSIFSTPHQQKANLHPSPPNDPHNRSVQQSLAQTLTSPFVFPVSSKCTPHELKDYEKGDAHTSAVAKRYYLKESRLDVGKKAALIQTKVVAAGLQQHGSASTTGEAMYCFGCWLLALGSWLLAVPWDYL
jgi:hypothetical protein